MQPYIRTFVRLEPEEIITSVWNNAIVVRPRAGELGLLMTTRRFDADYFALAEAQDGPLRR